MQAIFEQMRGRFTALRDLPEEARAKAAATVRAEMRAGIEEILKPEQKARYAEIIAETAGRSGQSARGRIWVLAEGKPRAIDVRVVNLSTTRAVDDIAHQFSCEVYRSAVGEANVVKKMKEVNAVIGGEGSGGVIFPEVHYARDALVGIALTLQRLADYGKYCQH